MELTNDLGETAGWFYYLMGQEALDIAEKIFKLTDILPKKEDYGLTLLNKLLLGLLSHLTNITLISIK